MQVFSFVHDLMSPFAEWQVCTVFAALPVLWFLVCCPLRSKKVYETFSEILTALCAVVTVSTYDVQGGVLFTMLVAAECLLFYRFIPARAEKKRAVQAEKKEEAPPVPRKVLCYEPPAQQPPAFEMATHSLEEANLCLEHAFDVAERLKSCALSGSDRLETDNIEITLQMYRAKGILTDKEMRSLNDCLAMLLKLTAKYEC